MNIKPSVLLFASLLLVTTVSPLSDKPDPSLIAAYHCPDESFELYHDKLVDKSIEHIGICFQRDEFLDYLLGVKKGHEKVLLKDTQHYDDFKELLKKKLDHFLDVRAKLYRKALATSAEIEKIKSSWNLFKKSKLPELEQQLEKETSELKKVDMKILKIQAFDEYCHNQGCVAYPKKRSWSDELSDKTTQTAGNVSNFFGKMNFLKPKQ